MKKIEINLKDSELEELIEQISYHCRPEITASPVVAHFITLLETHKQEKGRTKHTNEDL